MKSTDQSFSIVRILLKAAIFFLLINFLFVLLKDIPIGSISLYNHALHGRLRFPFGENPAVSYNLSLYNLDAMVSSHEVSSSRDSEEFSVFLIGDSSVWGYLQKPDQTLAGLLEKKGLICDNQPVRFYNLGYPSLSVMKDAMIIEKVQQFKPDLILWLVTLESLPVSIQMTTPLVENNPILVNRIISNYDLPQFQAISTSIWDNTLISRRRELADLLRLQIYGALWSATGIDQEYPSQYNTALRDFETDFNFHDFEIGQMKKNQLAIDIISQTIRHHKGIRFIVINEPILISQGINSDIRYNFYYPRWAFDQYREIMQAEMDESGIKYYDFWNLIPETHFTNSAIHLDYYGERIFSDKISTLILENCQKQ